MLFRVFCLGTDRRGTCHQNLSLSTSSTPRLHTAEGHANLRSGTSTQKGYRSIQCDCRQRFFSGGISCPITDTESSCQKNQFPLRRQICRNFSHYRFRFSLEFQLISIIDPDFGLKTNEFCSNFGYNGISDDARTIPHMKVSKNGCKAPSATLAG